MLLKLYARKLRRKRNHLESKKNYYNLGSLKLNYFRSCARRERRKVDKEEAD